MANDNKNKLQQPISFLLESCYLNELNAVKDAPNKEDLFGQYFDGEHRGVPSHEYEENTREEEQILNALQTYFQDNRKDPLDSKIPTIDKLVKQGKYKKFLQAPAGKETYRIIVGIPVAVASKLLRLPVQELTSDSKQGWYVSGGGTLTPNASKIQGWTLDPNSTVVSNITQLNSHANNKTCTVVFVSNTTSGGKFYLNGRELADTGADAIPGEEEVVSYGPVKFKEAAYFYFDRSVFSLNVSEQIKSCMVALNTKHAEKFEKQLPKPLDPKKLEADKLFFNTTLGAILELAKQSFANKNLKYNDIYRLDSFIKDLGKPEYGSAEYFSIIGLPINKKLHNFVIRLFCKYSKDGKKQINIDVLLNYDWLPTIEIKQSSDLVKVRTRFEALAKMAAAQNKKVVKKKPPIAKKVVKK